MWESAKKLEDNSWTASIDTRRPALSYSSSSQMSLSRKLLIVDVPLFTMSIASITRPNCALDRRTVLCRCMFLDSKDKYLNMIEFCRNDQRKVKNKTRTKGASLLRNPLTMHKMHSLAS